jgi:hypothetical protein
VCTCVCASGLSVRGASRVCGGRYYNVVVLQKVLSPRKGFKIFLRASVTAYVKDHTAAFNALARSLASWQAGWQ